MAKFYRENGALTHWMFGVPYFQTNPHVQDSDLIELDDGKIETGKPYIWW